MWPALRQACFALGLVVLPATAPAAVLLGSPARLAVDGSPLAVALADFDGDGAGDVLTANESGGDGPSLSVVLGRGDGSFGAEERLNLDPSRFLVHAVAAGDFDADGNGDLAVAVDDLATFPPHAAVLVYRNQGNRQFGRAIVHALDGLAARGLEAADLDGDGDVDLVVCLTQPTDGTGRIIRLAGDGDGGFAIDQTLAAGFLPSMVEVDDVDRDGRVDLLVADAADPQVSIFFGAASGYAPAVSLAVGAIASAVRVVVDSDSDLPLLAITSAIASEIQVLVQATARDFQQGSFTRVDDPPSSAVAVDLDRDGVEELVTLSAERARIAVYRVAASASRRLQRLTTAAFPNHLQVADFDADGRPDVAVASAGADAAEVFLNGRSPGTPQPSTTATVEATASVPTSTPVASVIPATPVPATATARPSATPTQVTLPTAAPTATPFLPLPTVTATATPAPQPGDANCDGSIDDSDVSELVWQMFRPYCDGADVNGDGMLSAADIILLMEMLEPAP